MLEYAFMQNALLVSVLISLMCPMIGMFWCCAAIP